MNSEILISRQLIEAADRQRVLEKPVPSARRLDLVVRHDLECHMKTLIQLILPLLRQTTRTHDQTPLQIAARHQLLDEEARHDRFAGPGIVREQEAKRLSLQHLPIHSSDLVWQRLNERGLDCEVRIEEVRESDSIGFGNQAQ
jgi:hypothetical protein